MARGGKGCLLVAGTEGEIQIPHLGPQSLQLGRDTLLVLGGVEALPHNLADTTLSCGYKEALKNAPHMASTDMTERSSLLLGVMKVPAASLLQDHWRAGSVSLRVG